MINFFWKFVTHLRWIVLFLIVLLFFFSYLQGHVLDLEFRTPEWEIQDQHCRERENKEAFDRVMKDDTNDERDYEKAFEYVRDNLAFQG